MQKLDDIHPLDWRLVARKKAVKAIYRHIEKRCARITGFYISPRFGSVYIDIGLGQYDADYDTYDQVFTIRIADHERVSSSHGYPDLNVYENHQLAGAIEQIDAALAS